MARFHRDQNKIECWHYDRNKPKDQQPENYFYCTRENIDFFMQCYPGYLMDLLGGRGNNQFLDYEKLSEVVWQYLKDHNVPGIKDTFSLATFDSSVDKYLNLPYEGSDEDIIGCLTRHLDDRHDLYQNLPYYLDDVAKAHNFEYTWMDEDKILYQAIKFDDDISLTCSQL